ncbi:hypothetical protein OAA_08345 [Vibrio cyclitrophicus 1F175]|nr:hypothetical protein OAI_18830 [Vibrio cyclitrophicus FF160]OEF28391.1 hypothetical protein OA9_13475 [Vibrio cyclitrophicus 1F97]OEF33251.1 hypothetical protein OA7_14260 [Vibrio cyclitrophicus 1F53]OEF44678.1 hypothetical protein OAC_08095 [Vibrio cyclitrophicus 1F273]OEF66736.1 hypothetical protein OAA_08345 [Vibrio cyclitrophicus 1F175]OEF77698.1 hypothetical protein OA5_16765 [Vibrio cyclitrophicus 1F111]PMH36230.1 hypothetical protein BCU72_08680 [Vibrio cyclitrophicus]
MITGICLKTAALIEKAPSTASHFVFESAVHPTHQVSYVWIRKGQDKLIEATSTRTRLNLSKLLMEQ